MVVAGDAAGDGELGVDGVAGGDGDERPGSDSPPSRRVFEVDAGCTDRVDLVDHEGEVLERRSPGASHSVGYSNIRSRPGRKPL